MKLVRFMTRNFRSIKEASIDNCGGFNVLIGKNNSGKSNLLSAIGHFFRFFRQKQIITIDFDINREIDFYNKETSNPIELTALFRLDLSERDALLNEIASEAPQMKHAVEGLDPTLLLAVSLTIVSSPITHAYVSSMILVPSQEEESRVLTEGQVLLKVPFEVSSELAERDRMTKEEIDSQIPLFSSILEESDHFWRRKERGVKTVLIRRRLPADVSSKVEQLINKADSLEQLQLAIQAEIDELNEEKERILKAPLKESITTFAGDSKTVPKYILNLIERIRRLTVLRVPERRRKIEKEDAERLLELKVRRGGPDKLLAIQIAVESLLGVKIDAFQSDSDKEAELDVDDFLVEANGAGIREALRLVLDVKFKNPNIVIIEEPEVHLHPGLEITMRQFLKRISKEIQIFISTHSTNFLDPATFQNVYLVQKTDNATNVKLLTQEEAERDIPEELGLSLASLFMYERIIFVEGFSDEAILRQLSSTLEINLTEKNVGFIAIGGSRNIRHYAAKSTLDFLLKRNAKLWFVIDKDERDPEEIAYIKQKLGELVNTKVWKKREIENYLIDPETIQKLLEHKSQWANGATVPTIEEINSAIDSCTEELKQLAILKRVVRKVFYPIYPKKLDPIPDIETIQEELDNMATKIDNARSSITDVYNEVSEEIEKDWNNKCRDIVPGEELLDSVLKKFGFRFRKRNDSERLAQYLPHEKIDDEIKEFVKEVVD